MKNWRTIWSNTISRRLVLTFMFIILPIYIIGTNIYNWGFHAISDGITKSMISQASFYLEKLSLETQRIRIQLNNVGQDENLSYLVYVSQTMSNYQKSQEVIRLQYRLNAIKNSSNYIKDVKACISILPYTISAAKGVNFYEDRSEGILDSPPISQLSQMIYWRDNYYLINYYRSTYKNKVLYWIETSLDKTAFTSDLMQFDTYKESISVMYCPENGEYLSYGTTDDCGILSESLKHQLSISKTGTYCVDFQQKKYYGYYSASDYLGLAIVTFVPENIVLSPVKGYQLWLWLFLAMSLVIIVIFSVSTYSFIHKPLNILLDSFDKLEGGNLSIKIEHRHNDEFKHIYHSFNKMVINLQTLFDQVYNQKLLRQNAELKQLQAQINPHFLYNSFFILYSIARAGDNDTVMSFLQQLGNYFKYIARSAEDEVPLSREVEHAKIYANIQALRFSNRITIDFAQTPEHFHDVIVPKLIIQPIIENSFKYGLEEKSSDGILCVRFADDGECLRVFIEDNGYGMGHADLQKLRETLDDKRHSVEATGIVNIHRRLQLKFGENSGLSIVNSELGGLMVVINIQLHGGEHVQAIDRGR